MIDLYLQASDVWPHAVRAVRFSTTSNSASTYVVLRTVVNSRFAKPTRQLGPQAKAPLTNSPSRR
jgi:hypothetical protein